MSPPPPPDSDCHHHTPSCDCGAAVPLPMPTYLRHRSRTRTRSGPALKPTRPEPRRAAPATRARRPVYYDRVTDGGSSERASPQAAARSSRSRQARRARKPAAVRPEQAVGGSVVPAGQRFGRRSTCIYEPNRSIKTFACMPPPVRPASDYSERASCIVVTTLAGRLLAAASLRLEGVR